MDKYLIDKGNFGIDYNSYLLLAQYMQKMANNPTEGQTFFNTIPPLYQSKLNNLKNNLKNICRLTQRNS